MNTQQMLKLYKANVKKYNQPSAAKKYCTAPATSTKTMNIGMIIAVTYTSIILACSFGNGMYECNKSVNRKDNHDKIVFNTIDGMAKGYITGICFPIMGPVYAYNYFNQQKE
jgi:hypothetical protein